MSYPSSCDIFLNKILILPIIHFYNIPITFKWAVFIMNRELHSGIVVVVACCFVLVVRLLCVLYNCPFVFSKLTLTKNDNLIVILIIAMSSPSSPSSSSLSPSSTLSSSSPSSPTRMNGPWFPRFQPLGGWRWWHWLCLWGHDGVHIHAWDSVFEEQIQDFIWIIC